MLSEKYVSKVARALLFKACEASFSLIYIHYLLETF